ncbi:MAG TPA: hypothetical protein VFW50_41060, partial [Streptosporangiaceae bacterium]|nr:hypothetical protein [Streptosporangiaceae bacterium]
DVLRVLDRAAASRNPENAIVFRIVAATGCRRGEVCALKWSDVDLDGDAARVVIRRAVLDLEGRRMSAVKYICRFAYTGMCRSPYTGMCRSQRGWIGSCWSPLGVRSRESRGIGPAGNRRVRRAGGARWRPAVGGGDPTTTGAAWPASAPTTSVTSVGAAAISNSRMMITAPATW